MLCTVKIRQRALVTNTAHEPKARLPARHISWARTGEVRWLGQKKNQQHTFTERPEARTDGAEVLPFHCAGLLPSLPFRPLLTATGAVSVVRKRGLLNYMALNPVRQHRRPMRTQAELNLTFQNRHANFGPSLNWMMGLRLVLSSMSLTEYLY